MGGLVRTSCGGNEEGFSAAGHKKTPSPESGTPDRLCQCDGEQYKVTIRAKKQR